MSQAGDHRFEDQGGGPISFELVDRARDIFVTSRRGERAIGVRFRVGAPLFGEVAGESRQSVGEDLFVARARLGKREGLEKHIRQYRNGRDITARPRGVMVIDLFGLSAEEVREKFPEVYQHVKLEVKEKVEWKNDKPVPVGRDANKRETYKRNWWIFGEPRSELRPASPHVPGAGAVNASGFT